MTISIDANVLGTIWSDSDPNNQRTAEALDILRPQGRLIVCGFVYAELLASQRSSSMVDHSLRLMDIQVEWEMDEPVFRTAGAAFAGYAERRRQRSAGEPRRMMTDFLIGAHAEVNGYSVFTLDRRIFQAAFPRVKLLRG